MSLENTTRVQRDRPRLFVSVWQVLNAEPKTWFRGLFHTEEKPSEKLYKYKKLAYKFHCTMNVVLCSEQQRMLRHLYLATWPVAQFPSRMLRSSDKGWVTPWHFILLTNDWTISCALHAWYHVFTPLLYRHRLAYSSRRTLLIKDGQAQWHVTKFHTGSSWNLWDFIVHIYICIESFDMMRRIYD